jgi:hypothetical protein
MRSQNKILAGSSKTTVVLFVIQLLLLFDKLSQVSQVSQASQVSPSFANSLN